MENQRFWMILVWFCGITIGWARLVSRHREACYVLALFGAGDLDYQISSDELVKDFFYLGVT